MIQISREAGYAVIGGIIGSFVSMGITMFSNSFFGNTWQEILSNCIGFAFFFLVLLIVANYLFNIVDRRIVTEKQNKKSK